VSRSFITFLRSARAVRQLPFETRQFPAGEFGPESQAGWYWWLPAEPKQGPHASETLARGEAIAVLGLRMEPDTTDVRGAA
jgi:hypothetical protein